MVMVAKVNLRLVDGIGEGKSYQNFVILLANIYNYRILSNNPAAGLFFNLYKKGGIIREAGLFERRV